MDDQLAFSNVNCDQKIKGITELDRIYFQKLVALLDKNDLRFAEIKFRKNAKNTSYQSIVVNSKATSYRDSTADEITFARLKTAGKTQYIAFPAQNRNLLISAGLSPANESENDKKDNFIRFELNTLNQPTEPFKKAVNQIFSNSFSFPAFGCCAMYIDCSNAKKCIHPDRIYSKACMYRKNLEQGKIFYGVNKNI